MKTKGMIFDTADKKPKLYGLLALTGVYAAGLAAMLIADPERLLIPMCILSMAYLAGAVLLLVRAFIRQLRYNPYSYNTIYYIGFALFVSSIFATHALLLVRFIGGGTEGGADMILRVFLNSAKNYMLLSAPFIFVFSAALLVSNISLLRHERKRLVNVLAIIAALLMTAGELVFFRYDMYASGSRTQVMLHDIFGNLFACLYLYFECMVIGSIIANIIVVRVRPDRDRDYIIVLGCGLRKDGSLTPLLRGRCDAAIAFYRQQLEETGMEARFVTSGGQGPGEVRSESSAMREYLVSQGIREELIIEEDRSSDTLENMRFSKEKLDAEGGSHKPLFATTNYHVFRSGLCARRVKLRAVGVGAKTKWYFWPNAAVREFLGLVASHRVKQAVIVGCMAAFYVVMTLIMYRQ